MWTKIIAEVGCNHQGNLGLAKKMIHAAAECGVDYVKFQKRTPGLMGAERFNKPYDNPHSFGATYGEHRLALEFDTKGHETLWNWCRMAGVKYAVSVWDKDAYDAVKHIPMDFLKIPSAHNEDWDLLKYVANNWGKEVHVSAGMIDYPLNTVVPKWKELFGDKLVVYACTSTYPSPAGEVKLLDIRNISRCGAAVGFSGHHNGIALDIAAFALGAQYIERHFTLDRTMKGTDHAASLEPQGMQKLVRDIKAVNEAWDGRTKMQDGEVEIAKKLKVVTEDTHA
jgi:N-acetylneuraminate synthase